MSQFRSPQGRQAKTIEVAEVSDTDTFSTTPPITNPLVSTLQQQEFPTTGQLNFALATEIDTEQLEFPSSLPFPIEIGKSTRELSKPSIEAGINEPRITRDLGGAHTTRVLAPATTRTLTNNLPGTAPLPGKSRAAVVIPGKKKRAAKTQSKRLHPRLRYGLIVGSMVGIIGIALMTLTPLNNDQNQLPALGTVVRWIQTQQITWNVSSRIADNQGTTDTTNTTTPPIDSGAPPVTILPTSQYIAIARQAAIAVGISPVYFVNQINAESSFNPYAVSPVGAVGIAQFLPSTAAGLGINPYDPIQALNGAALHMATMMKSYNGNYAMALAAYNAGPGIVDYAVQRGGANWMNFVPYETRQYIYKIMGI